MSNEPGTLPNSNLNFINITTHNIVSDGDFTVSSLTALSQIETTDIMIKLANGNTADVLDTGWYSQYNDGATKYRGCVYDASASKFVFFNSTTDPSATIGSGYTLLDVTVKDLVSTNMTGTLLTAAQPNITSIGTLTGLVMSGALNMGSNAISNATTIGCTTVNATTVNATTLAGTLSTAAQPNITSVGTLTSLTLSGTLFMGTNAISGATTVSATTLAGTLSTAAQPNITSVGTLTSLVLSGAITAANGLVSAPSYSFSNSTGSGMYYTGTANTIALATNGVCRLMLNTTDIKVDSSVNLAKNASFTFRTMQNNSSSTSATVSTTQDFQYQYTGAPTEVYVHDSNTTSGVSTNTAVGLLSAPLMVYTSTQSNGCYLDYDCKSISFAKGVYKLIHSHLYNDNTAIIDVGIKHSGSGSYTTYRSIDTFSGRVTTSNLFNYYETYFAVTTAGTINIRFTANGKNAGSTAYFVCVGNIRLYLLSSIA